MDKNSKAKGRYQVEETLERVEDLGRSPVICGAHVLNSSWEWRCEEHLRD